MVNVDIIIPIYNSEKYLSGCLNSIINQTYVNWRAICVDDGSIDSSYEILKTYAEKDNRFKIYRKSNGGVSSARNYALNFLRDDCWVAFVDSDDYIGPHMFSDLVSTLEEVSDASCNYVRTFCISTTYRNDTTRVGDKSYELLTVEQYFSSGEIGGFIASAFIHSKIIKDNNLRFDENMCILEDQVFLINAALCSPKILIFNQRNYYYYYNPLSLTAERKDRGGDIIRCVNHIFSMTKKYHSMFFVKYVKDTFLPVKIHMYLVQKVEMLICNFKKGVFRVSLDDLDLLDKEISLYTIPIKFKDRLCFYLLRLFSKKYNEKDNVGLRDSSRSH